MLKNREPKRVMQRTAYFPSAHHSNLLPSYLQAFKEHALESQGHAMPLSRHKFRKKAGETPPNFCFLDYL
jgi:hypothetical protein